MDRIEYSSGQQNMLLDILPTDLTNTVERYSAALNQFIYATFSNDEISWLVSIRREIVEIEWSKDRCETIYWHYGPGCFSSLKLWKILTYSLASYGPNVPHKNRQLTYDNGVHEINFISDQGKDVFYNRFINTSPTVGIPFQREERSCNVWLDIKSIYLLMKRRFQHKQFSEPVIEARIVTLQFLDSIVEYTKDDVIALYLYLVSSAFNLELIGPSCSNTKEMDWNIEQFSKQCEKLYTILKDTISHLY